MTGDVALPDGRSLARLASLLADGSRAGMCLALLDGRAWTAGELARAVGVARSTASGHLDQLVAGGLLAEERSGRHRYVRLAGPSAAQVVEDLGAHAAPGPPARSLRAVRADAALARARTCYDHLAGRLGVELLDGLVARGHVVDGGTALTPSGRGWFERLGLRGARRPAARSCLDWTERRPHLGGAAGAVLCRHAVGAGWVERTGTGRAVRVTPAGARALDELLGRRDGSVTADASRP